MEWIEDKLGNVLKPKYGKDHKSLEDGIYPCYGSGGLMRYVSNKLADGPSILIPRKGTLNNIMFVEHPFWTVDTMFWSEINEEKVYPKYLYYSICKKDFASMNVGSAVPSMTVPVLNDIDIYYPKDIDDQHRIASILSSLDSKIETNNKINAKLEEMAQALFKSWFVDFEPFKDKGMVESELGMIPEGWRVGKLGDIAVVEKKSINPSKQSEILFSHYSLPAYDESKLPAKQYGSEIMSNKFMFNNRTTLLSKLNPHIKRIWYVEEVEENTICSTEFLPFKSIDDNCSAFLYSYLVSDSFYKVALSMVQGATNSHQRLDAKSLLDFDLAINEDAMKSFNDIVAPMLMTICKNRQENLRLSLLRDTLLPKLMSGEIEL